MPIQLLDRVLMDRIAAGEVIERPASAVKELVENALDAGATRVDVAIEAGGRRLIRVVDDGCGMDAADLALAVERHATSKLPEGDLAAIRTLGFRGEALPSIASVALLSIATRTSEGAQGHALSVDAGRKGEVRPGAQPRGTRIEVHDLFAATPARLKFLKSDRAEARADRAREVRVPVRDSGRTRIPLRLRALPLRALRLRLHTGPHRQRCDSGPPRRRCRCWHWARART